jgi:hypothetical protein
MKKNPKSFLIFFIVFALFRFQCYNTYFLSRNMFPKGDLLRILHSTTFESISDRDLHVLNGHHTISKQTNTADKIKTIFIQKKNPATNEKSSAQPNHWSAQSTEVRQSSIYGHIGHALKKRKPSKHFSVKQKRFLYEAYIEGEKKG